MSWAVASIAVLVAGCGMHKSPAEYPADQRTFHAINKGCRSAYQEGINEIQKSVAFNRCNEERRSFERGVSGWVGTLTDISTDQGADVVSVTIEATVDGMPIAFSTVGNRLSDFGSDTLIVPSNPLFHKLAGMQVGEAVSFSAEFLHHPDTNRGLWEASLTELGSMDEPEFIVKFVAIDSYQRTSEQRRMAGDPLPPHTSGDAKDGSKAPVSTVVGTKIPNEESASVQNFAPSFDCKLANNETERAICSNSRLARVDVYTAEMYRCMLHSSSTDTDELRFRQRSWITKRNSCLSDVGCLRGSYGDIAEEYMKHGSFEDCNRQVNSTL